jgi:nucleotide-binding universal stress UspA family protein
LRARRLPHRRDPRHLARTRPAPLGRPRAGRPARRRLGPRRARRAILLGDVAALADVAGVAAEIRSETETALATAVEGLPVEVDARAVSGVLAVELDVLAAEVDLMVCGSRGWGTAHRVTLGSTSDRLIHHAPCPVLVVPHTAVASTSGRPRSEPQVAGR